MIQSLWNLLFPPTSRKSGPKRSSDMGQPEMPADVIGILKSAERSLSAKDALCLREKAETMLRGVERGFRQIETVAPTLSAIYGDMDRKERERRHNAAPAALTGRVVDRLARVNQDLANIIDGARKNLDPIFLGRFAARAENLSEKLFYGHISETDCTGALFDAYHALLHEQRSALTPIKPTIAAQVNAKRAKAIAEINAQQSKFTKDLLQAKTPKSLKHYEIQGVIDAYFGMHSQPAFNPSKLGYLGIDHALPSLPHCQTFGELTGYRAWKFRDGFLVSPHQGTPWEPGEIKKADQKPSASQFGIFAHKQPEQVFEQEHKRWDVVGSVLLWGDVVEHENGYRAEYARPHEMLFFRSDLPDATRRFIKQTSNFNLKGTDYGRKIDTGVGKPGTQREGHSRHHARNGGRNVRPQSPDREGEGSSRQTAAG